jgi:hypothetical protein
VSFTLEQVQKVYEACVQSEPPDYWIIPDEKYEYLKLLTVWDHMLGETLMWRLWYRVQYAASGFL